MAVVNQDAAIQEELYCICQQPNHGEMMMWVDHLALQPLA
jgi:hypothetical protein